MHTYSRAWMTGQTCFNNNSFQQNILYRHQLPEDMRAVVDAYLQTGTDECGRPTGKFVVDEPIEIPERFQELTAKIHKAIKSGAATVVHLHVVTMLPLQPAGCRESCVTDAALLCEFFSRVLLEFVPNAAVKVPSSPVFGKGHHPPCYAVTGAIISRNEAKRQYGLRTPRSR